MGRIMLDGIELTEERLYGIVTKGMLDLELMCSLTTAVELLTPEEAALKESARKDRIEKARQELIASLITTLTPLLSGLTSLVDDTLTTIKKQTIKLTTHNRLIISK